MAVKELQPKTVLADVRHEASILAEFSHPYVSFLPLWNLFKEPFSIVMQFHGLSQSTTSRTFQASLRDKSIPQDSWLGLFSQFVEGIRCLHDDAAILHNDEV